MASATDTSERPRHEGTYTFGCVSARERDADVGLYVSPDLVARSDDQLFDEVIALSAADWAMA